MGRARPRSGSAMLPRSRCYDGVGLFVAVVSVYVQTGGRLDADT